MYYKVIVSKVCYVEATDIVEAKEKAMEDDFIQAVEKVTSIERTTKKKAMDLYSDID